MTREELNTILENHKHWWNEDCEDWRSMRANLSGADLRGANLSGADLSRANLSEADLRGANLSGADLSRANLSEADLSGADLSEADLSGANLSRANLSGANLSEADLSGANLSRANLSGAYLRGANLSGADLSRANLSGAKNLPYIPYACPDFGMFIGFKKARGADGEPVIVCLEIPEDAKRLSATGRKCRCNKAKVLNIKSIDGKKEYAEARSDYDKNFIYRTGEIVSVEDFCEDRWQECSPGIHFFINRQEAVEY